MKQFKDLYNGEQVTKNEFDELTNDNEERFHQDLRSRKK